MSKLHLAFVARLTIVPGLTFVPALAIVALLYCLASYPSLAADLAGKECDLKPKWSAVVKALPNRQTDALYDVALAPDGSIYVLVTTRSIDDNSQLLKLNQKGQLQWRTDIKEEATAIAAASDGIWLTAWQYNRSSGNPVSKPYLLQISPAGRIVLEKEIPAPFRVSQEGKRNSDMDLVVKGEAKPWRICAITGGCVVSGVGSADNSSIVYIQRLDGKGQVQWSTAVPATYDIFSAGPLKTEPELQVVGDRVLVAGPFQVRGSQTQAWLAWLDLKTGKMISSVSPSNSGDGNFAYAAMARNPESGQIAIAGKTTVTVFNHDLSTAAVLHTDAIPFSVGWRADNSLVIGGMTVKQGNADNDFMPVDLPTMSSGSLKDKALKPFETISGERLWQSMLLTGADPYFIYANVTSKSPHVISSTALHVKHLKNGKWESYSYAPECTLGEICIRPCPDGFLVVFDDGKMGDSAVDVLQF